MAQVFIGIGSNLGNRRENIRRAISLLKKENIRVVKISKVIQTDPSGGPPQPKFLNAVIKVHTPISASYLLKKIKKIEKIMGRRRTLRFGPRIIDLDILVYGNVVLKSKDLTIPHPRMWEREFVLKPLGSLISSNSLARLKKRLKDKK